ncbi:General stress protein 26 [compost metagenome]
MALFHDGLQIYLATNRQSHKVEELEEKPHIALLFGYEGDGSSAIVEVQAKASVTKNNELRGQLWNDGLKRWFKGPDDPNYVILDISPSRIEYTDKEKQLHVWEAH